MEETTSAVEEQLVVFDLANEMYGVDIACVREIIRMQSITKVPGLPEFVQGVINLRGKVIPVLGLRSRFGLAVAEHGKEGRIVVVDIKGQDIGMVVDAVSAVLRIGSAAIEPPSCVISNVESEYLRGIAKVDGKLIILLDLDKVLTRTEKQTLSMVGKAKASAAA